MLSSVVVCLFLACIVLCIFFFNNPATTEIYTLSLHDALPISSSCFAFRCFWRPARSGAFCLNEARDRKSTRLNSSHGYISYAVFCLKKKNNLSCICPYSTPLSSVGSPAYLSYKLRPAARLVHP